MGMDLYRKIVDEAATIPEIGEYVITGLSESLLDPDLVKRVKYLREREPDAHIAVYTNGTYLTPLRFRDLQDAGLSMILVSMNGADAETRKRVMGLDDWDTLTANLLSAIALETTCKVRLRAVVNEDSFTKSQADVLVRIFGWQVEDGRFLPVAEGNWAGETRTVRTFDPAKCCSRALETMYVTYDGKVTPCCFDPLGKMVFGDLNTQTIREVYNSPAYVQFREDHFNDQADKYPMCASCTRI